MFTHESAERFVRAWKRSESVEDAADKLGRPPVVLNRLAGFLLAERAWPHSRPQSIRPEQN
jgi:hypothetical protein